MRDRQTDGQREFSSLLCSAVKVNVSYVVAIDESEKQMHKWVCAPSVAAVCILELSFYACFPKLNSLFYIGFSTTHGLEYLNSTEMSIRGRNDVVIWIYLLYIYCGSNTVDRSSDANDYWPTSGRVLVTLRSSSFCGYVPKYNIKLYMSEPSIIRLSLRISHPRCSITSRLVSTR